MMKTNEFPRFFAFGERYVPGDDYVRCDRPDYSVVVAPGVGEVPATDELSLERCVTFVIEGRMSEANREAISCSPELKIADRRQVIY